MAAHSETKIFEGLCAHLVDLSTTLDIEWPNKDFDKPPGGYLRVQHFPNTTDQVTLGESGKNRQKGIFQIDIFKPKGSGEVNIREVGGSIAAHFKLGTVISQESIIVRVLKPPLVAQLIVAQKAANAQLPVLIEYQADFPNPT